MPTLVQLNLISRFKHKQLLSIYNIPSFSSMNKANMRLPRISSHPKTKAFSLDSAYESKINNHSKNNYSGLKITKRLQAIPNLKQNQYKSLQSVKICSKEQSNFQLALRCYAKQQVSQKTRNNPHLYLVKPKLKITTYQNKGQKTNSPKQLGKLLDEHQIDPEKWLNDKHEPEDLKNNEKYMTEQTKREDLNSRLFAEKMAMFFCKRETKDIKEAQGIPEKEQNQNYKTRKGLKSKKSMGSEDKITQKYPNNLQVIRQNTPNSIDSRAIHSYSNQSFSNSETYMQRINFKPLSTKDQCFQKMQLKGIKKKQSEKYMHFFFRGFLGYLHYRKKLRTIFPNYSFIMEKIIRQANKRGKNQKTTQRMYIGQNLYQPIRSKPINPTKTEFFVILRSTTDGLAYPVEIDIKDSLSDIVQKVKNSKSRGLQSEITISHLYQDQYKHLFLGPQLKSSSQFCITKDPESSKTIVRANINSNPLLHQTKKQKVKSLTEQYYSHFLRPHQVNAVYRYKNQDKKISTKQIVQKIRKITHQIVTDIIMNEWFQDQAKTKNEELQSIKVHIRIDQKIEMLKEFCRYYQQSVTRTMNYLQELLRNKRKQFEISYRTHKHFQPNIRAILDMYDWKYRKGKVLVSNQRVRFIERQQQRNTLLYTKGKFIDSYIKNKFYQSLAYSENQRSLCSNSNKSLHSKNFRLQSKHSIVSINNLSDFINEQKKQRVLRKESRHSDIYEPRNKKITFSHLSSKEISDEGFLTNENKNHEKLPKILKTKECQFKPKKDHPLSIIRSRSLLSNNFKSFKNLKANKYQNLFNQYTKMFSQQSFSDPRWLIKINHNYLLARYGSIVDLNSLIPHIASDVTISLYWLIQTVPLFRNRIFLVPYFHFDPKGSLNQHIYLKYSNQLVDSTNTKFDNPINLSAETAKHYQYSYSFRILELSSFKREKIGQKIIRCQQCNIGCAFISNALNYQLIIKQFIAQDNQKKQIVTYSYKPHQGRKNQRQKTVRIKEQSNVSQKNISLKSPSCCYFRVSINFFPWLNMMTFICERTNPLNRNGNPIKYLVVGAISDVYFQLFKTNANTSCFKGESQHELKSLMNIQTLKEIPKDALALKREISQNRKGEISLHNIDPKEKHYLDLSAHSLEYYNYHRMGIVHRLKKRLLKFLKIKRYPQSKEQTGERKSLIIKTDKSRYNQLRMHPILNTKETHTNIGRQLEDTFLSQYLISIKKHSKNWQVERNLTISFLNFRGQAKEVNFSLNNQSNLLHLSSCFDQSSYYKFLSQPNNKAKYPKFNICCKIMFQKSDDPQASQKHEEVFWKREQGFLICKVQKHQRETEDDIIMKYVTSWSLQPDQLRQMIAQGKNIGRSSQKSVNSNFMRRVRRRFEGQIIDKLHKNQMVMGG